MKVKLFLIFILFVFLREATASAYESPVPKDTIKQNEQEFIVNSQPQTLEFYQSKASLEEIISFYKENLSRQGFILFNEDKLNQVVIFIKPSTKENLVFHIDSIKDDLTHYSISRSKGNLLMQSPNELKKKVDTDAPGRDVPGIPRYPDSIRISNMENYGMINAVYKTPHKKEEIISFYENKMPSYGWKRFSQESLVQKKASKILGEESLFSSSESLLFEKAKALCGIVVVSISGCQQGCLPGVSSEGSMVSILSYQIGEKR